MDASVLFQDDNTTIRIYVACASGFTPVYIGNEIVACKQISNDIASTGDVFNKCSKCVGVKAQASCGCSTQLPTSIVPRTLPRPPLICLISFPKGQWAFYRPGFIMTQFGNCQKLQIPDCQDESFSTYPTINLADDKLYFKILHLAKPDGCSKFKELFHSAQMEWEVGLCFPDMTMSLVRGPNTHSELTERYKRFTRISCVLCQPDYALNMDGRACMIKFNEFRRCPAVRSLRNGLCEHWRIV